MLSSFLSRLLGPGRSGTFRGLVGLLVAPVVANTIFPGTLLIGLYFSEIYSEPSGSPIPPSAILLGLGLSYLLAVAIAFVIGGPVWFVLRRKNRESGRAYLIAGAIGGICPYLAMDLRNSWFDTVHMQSLLLIYLPCAVSGAIAALIFWSIARRKGGLARPAD